MKYLGVKGALAEKRAETDAARDFISKKIGILRGEGKPEDQAVAIAHSMAREKGYDVPDAPSEDRPGAVSAEVPAAPYEVTRYRGNRPSESRAPVSETPAMYPTLLSAVGQLGAGLQKADDALAAMHAAHVEASEIAFRGGGQQHFDAVERGYEAARKMVAIAGHRVPHDIDYFKHEVARIMGGSVKWESRALSVDVRAKPSMEEAALVPWRDARYLAGGNIGRLMKTMPPSIDHALDTLAGEMVAYRDGHGSPAAIKRAWDYVYSLAGSLSDRYDQIQHLAHSEKMNVIDVSEALDVGQESEAEMAAKGFADAAEVVKALRESSFKLCTDNLVRLESLTQAVDAKKANRLVSKLREMCAEFNDMVGEIADGLEEANDVFKGESGGKGGEDHGADANAPEPEEVPVAAPAAPAAPVTTAAPVAAAPAQAPAPAAEGVVAKAVARLVGGRVSDRIREGDPYADVALAILGECVDLGLDAGQVSEVHSRLQAAEAMATPRAYRVRLSEDDRGTLAAVRGGVSDPVSMIVARTANGSAAVVSESDLDTAVRALRRFGGPGQRDLAGRLAGLMGAGAPSLAGVR
jgi:hypothetical protein